MWLDRFERVDGELTVVGIEKSGATAHLSPDQMYKSYLGPKQFDTMTFRTSFSDWQRASTREYAAAFGFNSGVSEQHETYRVRTEHANIVISTWLLQQDLLAVPATVARYVYVPNGLEQLCSPIVDADEFRAEIVPHRNLTKTKKSPYFVQRLAWFYAYPSAYRAWNSFYRFACAGKIAIELPAAEALMSARGKYLGDTFYASSLDIVELRPLETPLGWAKVDEESFTFANERTQLTMARKTRDSRLRPHQDKWNVTDEEWSVIEKIVQYRPHSSLQGRVATHPVRDTINGIIIKMGSGVGWQEATQKTGVQAAAMGLYKRIKADGRWDKIVEFLAATRPQP